ncbi:MAG: YheT family hydrolase [Bryobacteraceae bacterium]
MRPFEPLFRNAHLATIAGNFWKRPESESRFPVEAVVYRTEPEVGILVHAQQPRGAVRGELILVHGLQGSSDAGYARSLACAALEAGYATHRLNLRSCGESESLSLTNYHSGQTSDVLYVIREIKRASGLPIFLAGFSLGGNVSLKLAGELGESARELLAGVCAVSTPIDLLECAKALGRRQNFIYSNRFLKKLKTKMRRRAIQAPHIYSTEPLRKIRTIHEFDDVYTAKLFGFGTAEKYYRTQSSNQFLEQIRVPTLLVIAKDDPMVPFSTYDYPAFRENPNLRLIAVEHGGHLGFISRKKPRFWLDGVILEWIEARENKEPAGLVS